MSSGAELSFFDVDGKSRPRCRDKQIGLTAEKRGNLEEVNDFRGFACLFRFVNIRQDGNADPFFHRFEDFKTFFKSWTAIGGYGRAVCFIE